ncbi:MAG: hypothetical protein KDI75_04725, partial [Xanthomonadales bacterium]|nr:hypothetical protein [Xanthomonadales bacterium]
MKALFELEARDPGEVLDHAFINAHCDGLDALRDGVSALDWPDIERESGLGEAAIREIADCYAKSKATMLTWCM